MMILVSIGVFALLACVGVVFYYQMTFGSEKKNIKRLLERELSEFEKLSFEDLVQKVKKEPYKIVKFGSVKLLRRLESREVLSNLANEMHVVVRISGTKNPALEESHVIAKQDKNSSY